MEKSVVWQRDFEEAGEILFTVNYWLLSQGTEEDGYYGVGIEKKKGNLSLELECVEGLCETKAVVEQFLYHLWLGAALPIELLSLCDDFISEKEHTQNFSMAS